MKTSKVRPRAASNFPPAARSEQQDVALRNVCVALLGQTDSDCRWGRSTGLETKAAWAHDKRNPASDEPPQ
jgi:hypothetical protein